jgi:cytochrome P450
MQVESQNAPASDSLQPPGPPPRLGLRLWAVQLSFLLNPFAGVGRRFARFGDTYRVRQRDGWLYVFRHPDHIRDVLVTNAAAFDKQHSAFRRLSIVLGDALLTSDGERWRRQRRMVQPAFARPRLAEYAQVMVEESVRACERLARGGAFDLGREFNALTLAIVTRTLFGQSPDQSEPTRDAMVELNRFFVMPEPVLTILPMLRRRLDGAIDALDRAIDRLIDTKRKATRASQPPGRDLLSALMQARDEDGDELSPRELRDQLLTLYLAGHETTSHALTWTLYLLSQHPEAREKLRAELERVLGGRPPRFEDLPALPYTEQVIKEALRLYPPAYVIPRRCSEETLVGPYRVPAHSEIILWIYWAQRDPRWFTEPEQFRPERFDPQAAAQIPKYAYLPFGAGQRACIGQAFAMIEAQLILATLLPRLEFEYTGKRPPRPRTGVTLAPRGGMPMRVRARVRPS